MKKIVIAGGTGFLGNSIAEHFIDSEIIILTRQKEYLTRSGRIKYVLWDGENVGSWVSVLQNSDVLINLSGKSVNCRYNENNKTQIYQSRLKSTECLGKAINECTVPPKLWINASSATIYRHSEDMNMDELSGENGTGFSVDVCEKWEGTFMSVDNPYTRKVAIRTSLVLGKEGSVYPVYKDLIIKGLGGTQGTGTQFVSWIHEFDFLRALEFIIKEENLNGIINICSPNPITNEYFMAAFRKSLNIKIGLRTYPWMVKLGAIFMRTEAELVLKSRRVVPKILIERGFQFRYPAIDAALKKLAD